MLLDVSDITPYLDATLKVLGLNIEARTSFITDATSSCCVRPTAPQPLLPRQEHVVTAGFQASRQNYPC